MKTSKELLKAANIIPKLRLGTQKPGGGVIPNGPHRVKILKDKIDKGNDFKTGKEVEVVKYLVEENGEPKAFERKKLNQNGELDYLVQRLAEIPEGAEIILEMKKKGIKNYVEVIQLGGVDSAEYDDEGHAPEEDEEVIEN